MFGRDGRLAERLRASGRRAPAEVLEADGGRVGVTHGNPVFVENTEMVWKLKLMVRPDGEEAFEAEVKARFPQLGAPRKGVVLSVLYDPDDHSKVVVDQSREGAAETAINTALSRNASLAANPELGGALPDLMREAVADPAAFRARMQEQARAGGNPLGPRVPGFEQPASARPDPVDQLAKLADLRDRGALSADEFEAQKRRILGEDHR